MNIDVKQYKGIAVDSRKVEEGFLFFCPATTDYIPQAIEKGAAAIVVEKGTKVKASVPVIEVENIRKAVSETAALFYPNTPKNIMAVTGTNGKTSTVTFVTQILDQLGHKSASIGTLGLSIGDECIAGENTTPGAIEFHQMMSELNQRGIDYVVFEASSHGLDQHRTENIYLKSAGFTNLTRDHIDYHKNMENYFQAKEKLFTEVLAKDGLAVLNADAPEFEALKKCGRKVLSYGKNADGLKLVSNEVVDGGQRVIIEAEGKRYDLTVKIAGHFQLMNILCAVGLVMGCGFSAAEIMPCLPNLKAPTGRLDLAGTYNGAEIFVDYAHTPDALENALLALQKHAKNKLAVVFGCGGDRDPGKRPMMGKSAEEFADIVYVTDDNPRSEDPQEIRRQVLAGCPSAIDAGDRESALKLAISKLQSGDVLLVAGKGHEDYQIIKGVKYDFSDIKKIKEIIGK